MAGRLSIKRYLAHRAMNKGHNMNHLEKPETLKAAWDQYAEEVGMVPMN